MATLHIVNKSSALESCLETATTNDCVLLIEDAVYQAALHTGRPLLALRDDLDARGLESRIGKNISVVDYAGFVELVENHQPVVSWR